MKRAFAVAAAALTLAGAAPDLFGPALAAPPSAANPWAGVTDTSLGEAIAAIEQATGGKVLEIRFRMRRGVVGYDAVVAKGDVISHVTIASDGRVSVIAETDIPEWMTHWTLQAAERVRQRAKFPLAEAVVKAERSAQAPAVDAAIALPAVADNAPLAYNVEVIKDGKPARVVIDALSGAALAEIDYQGLLQPWTPEAALYATLKNLR